MFSAAPAAAAAHPIESGVVDVGFEAGAATDSPLQAARDTGATMLRTPLNWAEVAVSDPANAADPADPVYRWERFDERFARIAAAGMQPLVYIVGAPKWTLRSGGGGAAWPDPAALRDFAEAAARRYGDVRYWQVWNEPNLDSFLEQPRDWAAGQYRAMVNAVADGVKRVDASNVVVAGGLGPFGGAGALGSDRGAYGVRPLPFMRRMLCLGEGRRPRAVCHARVRFDVWAHHPYTSGAPTREALQPGDASMGDLPEMRRLLVAAQRAGNVVAPRRVAFWATEFSWDTDPPDGGGVPPRLHARWVAEAMYRMWRSGISRAFWFQLRDLPLKDSIWQSGLYFGDGRGKPALRAFRFPFVAFARGRSIAVWARVPQGDAQTVVVEQRRAAGWRRVARVRSDEDGIAEVTVRRGGRGPLRARVWGSGETSRAFNLSRPPDRQFNPFGTGAAPED